MKREEMYNADNETTREEMYKSNVSLPPAEGAKTEEACGTCKWQYAKFEYKCEDCRAGKNNYEPDQPTAEGAEEIRVEYSEESLGFFRSFIRARKELCAISPTETYSLEEAIRKAFDGIFSQPTAEGAGEYLKAHLSEGEDMVISDRLRRRTKELMNGFAALHAQKIADKMVSERQREMWLNMQYYMEYCQYKGYVTPQEWIEKHKHF